MAAGQRRFGEMFETTTQAAPLRSSNDDTQNYRVGPESLTEATGTRTPEIIGMAFNSAPRLVGRIPTPSAVAAGTSEQSRGERGGYRLLARPCVTLPGQGVLRAGRALAC